MLAEKQASGADVKTFGRRMVDELSGAEFDRAYVDEMLKDHRTDVAEFRKVSQSSKDADVKWRTT